MPKRPTMKDVARAAGVSHMTVSRVVNGDTGVLPDKVSRVERAIRKLGYQRNDMARQLRRQGQTTGTIGLVVDDVANTFWSALARAVEDVAMRRGFLVLVGSTNDDRRREQEVVAAFCARRVDGLVVVPVAGSQRFLRTQMAMGTRVVCVDRPGDGLEVDTVVVDNRPGTRDAIAHLIGQGHERIGFLGDRDDIWTAEERYTGYLDALGDARIEPTPSHVRRGVRTAAQATEAARELMTARHPPTAIFTGNNMITIGAIAAFSQDDRPRATALVGFDDFPLADRLAPPVTVVQQDPAALGATAAQMLLARIEGDTAPPRTVVLKTRLLTRGSGEIPPP
ncbi:MAG TPA: LacI family DNA-binding transcriptional regulator [Acidimicrobiales bacterium]|nr:LacI family DNA-binding transcriptional regulator [Acidimicrobiales bacterium]